MSVDSNTVIEDFRAAMRQSGIEYAGDVRTGKLTRFNAEGEKGMASWYILHIDGVIPAGKFGCHRRDISVDYKYTKGANNLDKEAWAELREKMRKAELERKTDAERRLTEAKQEAQRMLSESKIPSPENGYLVRKKVGIYGEVRQNAEGCLVLPLRDIDGVLNSAQLIAPDKRFGTNDAKRDKDFIPGGKIQGCFYTVSDIQDGPLIICEGYATGVSIYEATGYAVVCAMFCGNLLNVAKAWRERYPQRTIILAADNDRKTKGNPGVTKATEASRAIKGGLAIPPFGNMDAPMFTDFNDYFVLYGQDAAAKVINDAYQELYTAASNAGLPPIDSATALLSDRTIVTPVEIIKGFLHQGLKAVLGSGSKARKTWILIDAAISVAMGLPFWKWETVKGRVLYINFEIPRAFMRSRIAAVLRAKEIPEGQRLDFLDVWTLRGFAAPLNQLLAEIILRIKGGGYVLVVIDPIYKGLGGRDENAAGDISELCNELEKIAVQSGAAVMYAAHFSKGNQSAKEAIDRIAGSGVWTRDADTIVTLTKHEEPDCFTVDMIFRNLPEAKPFVVKWEYPLMREQETMNPEDLKAPTEAKRGRKTLATSDEIYSLLPDEGLYSKEWQRRASESFGISRSVFFGIRKELLNAGRIILSQTSENWLPVRQAGTFTNQESQPESQASTSRAGETPEEEGLFENAEPR